MKKQTYNRKSHDRRSRKYEGQHVESGDVKQREKRFTSKEAFSLPWKPIACPGKAKATAMKMRIAKRA